VLQVSSWRVRAEERVEGFEGEGVRCSADVEVRNAKTEVCDSKENKYQ
jgi:hypothetical protein